MRNFIIIALCALFLTGCANGPYGNYLGKSATGVDQQKLASEAVNKLVILYPPAQIRLAMQQPTPDAFGLALVKGLREHGYAVQELNNKAAEAPSAASQALPLTYVVDQADNDLYRLTLMIGSQSLTRPYIQQGGKLSAAGYWVRKE